MCANREREGEREREIESHEVDRGDLALERQRIISGGGQLWVDRQAKRGRGGVGADGAGRGGQGKMSSGTGRGGARRSCKGGGAAALEYNSPARRPKVCWSLSISTR